MDISAALQMDRAYFVTTAENGHQDICSFIFSSSLSSSRKGHKIFGAGSRIKAILKTRGIFSVVEEGCKELL
jgi:hypothetical protein